MPRTIAPLGALAALAVGLSALLAQTAAAATTTRQSDYSAPAYPLASCAGLPPMALDASNQVDVLNLCLADPANSLSPPTNDSFMGSAGFQYACGVNYGYLRFGVKASPDQPPLVMIQGSAMTMADWTVQFLWDLSRTRELLVFDNQGVGLSIGGDDNATGPLSIQGQAENVFCLLSALGLGKVDVFGFSMGGVCMYVCTRLAACAKGFDICDLLCCVCSGRHMVCATRVHRPHQTDS